MKNFLKIVAATLIGSLIAMLAGFFLFMGFISSLASLTESKTPVVPSSAVMALNFSPAITEQSVEDPFSALNPFSSETSKSTGILEFIQTIDRAASDSRIKKYLNRVVVFHLFNPSSRKKIISSSKYPSNISSASSFS